MKSNHVPRQKILLSFVHINHFPQQRKYTGEPYSVHLTSVAELADKYKLIMGYEIGLCHDLFEDTACTEHELYHFLVRNQYTHLEAEFIINGVIELTDVYTHEKYPDTNRKIRKTLEAERLGTISKNSQSIKYCDLIDNTNSIVEYDKGFAIKYLEEKRLILSKMNKGNKHLYNKCVKLTK